MLIESSYIGRPGRRIYCSYHPPTGRLVRSTSVLLCAPLGHEYFRTYRACVKLAQSLGAIGFPALRFDYRGTGDSEGDPACLDIAALLDDIRAAANELHRREPETAIAFAGMRTGALLACRVLKDFNCRHILLWDPVLDGETFVTSINALHSGVIKDLQRFPKERAQAETGRSERVGVDFGPHLLRELSELRIGKLDSTLRGAIACQATEAPRNAPDGLEVIPLQRAYGWNNARRIEEMIVDPAATRSLTQALAGVAA